MLEDITKDFSDTFEGDDNVKTVYPYRGREKNNNAGNSYKQRREGMKITVK